LNVFGWRCGYDIREDLQANVLLTKAEGGDVWLTRGE